MRYLCRIVWLFALSAASPVLVASPEFWKPDIDAFTAADARQAPPADAVLFIGSSSIKFWRTLASDFAFTPTINRGFGGSELADSVYYADRIVIPCRPRAIVLYAGDNDLATGKSPGGVLADFIAFREKIHAALPGTPIFYLAVKLSPSRAQFADAARLTNSLIAADCAAHPPARSWTPLRQCSMKMAGPAPRFSSRTCCT